MGEAVERLEGAVTLARVWVPPYVRMVDGGQTIHVDGYWRRLQRRRRVARREGTTMQQAVDLLLGRQRDRGPTDSEIDSFLSRLGRDQFAEVVAALGAEPDPEWLTNNAAARRLLRSISGRYAEVTEIGNRILGHGGSTRLNSMNAPTGRI